jgi:hypothetical protein
MNISNIKSDVHFICGSTSATYPDVDMIRNINIAYQETARLIWTSAGGWQFDDSNATDLPIAKTTLVHNQQDYSLPTTAQRIEAVVVKDIHGDWHRLEPFDIHDITIAPEEYLSEAGLPLYYDLMGRSLMLYPKPSSAYCTLSSGMGIYLSRDMTEFAVTAATAVPGFATPFHRILSYAAAIDFIQDKTDKQLIIAQKDRLEKSLKDFYAKRAVEQQTRIKPRQRRVWRQYL